MVGVSLFSTGGFILFQGKQLHCHDMLPGSPNIEQGFSCIFRCHIHGMQLAFSPRMTFSDLPGQPVPCSMLVHSLTLLASAEEYHSWGGYLAEEF